MITFYLYLRRWQDALVNSAQSWCLTGLMLSSDNFQEAKRYFKEAKRLALIWSS